MKKKFPGKVYFAFPYFDAKARTAVRFFTDIMGSNYHCEKIIEKKFSQQNKVLGNIEKFAENQGLQTFFFNEKVS